MPIQVGSRLGPYVVTALIDAGGMGEVYCARDTKLNRNVALKVLPDNFAHDPDRVARFRREAQLLASLNHPNIGAVYGAEDNAGILALVMEFVPGSTLADRILEGPLPIDEALLIGLQIAEALEAAHEHGIIHRDLKPSNIKLTTDGRVKVLDFGLAKALTDRGAPDSAITPTMTALATGAGVILGTPAYMSPEQAKGKGVDTRTDIWAFGCVLYEMLTARPSFGGDTVTDVLAAVLTKEPDWDAVKVTTPRVRDLLRRCLKKNPRERLRDIGDARLEIAEALREVASPDQFRIEPPHARRFLTVGLILSGVGIGLLLGTLGRMWTDSRFAAAPLSSAESTARIIRSTITLPPHAPLSVGAAVPLVGFDSSSIALSPDGSRAVYVGRSGSETMLFMRAVSEFDVKAIPGTEGAIHPFFSPDGRWIGFLTDDKVKKVAVDGGKPQTLCEANIAVRATWTRDDQIYFAANQGSELMRVSARGGPPESLTPAARVVRRDKINQVLPDGKSALVTVWSQGIGGDYADIMFLSLETQQMKLLLRSGYDARYVPPGYLLFARSGNLHAVRFHSERGEISGEPVIVATGVSMDSLHGQAHVAVSNNGLLAYVPGGDRSVGRIAWVDRDGNTEFLSAPPRIYGLLNLSLAGDRLAVHVADAIDYIWLYDLKEKRGRRFPTADHAGWPVWSPDGLKIAFTSGSLSARDQSRIVVQAVDGRSDPQPVVPTGDSRPYVTAWSAGTEVLAVRGVGPVTLAGKKLTEQGHLSDGPMLDFSPDGRWAAYVRVVGGVNQIWIQSMTRSGETRQISSEGGFEPFWCQCGKLFYRNGNQWMVTAVATKLELRWTPPSPVFQTDFIDTPGRSYAVSRDGQRLLVVKAADRTTPDRIHLVSNWIEEFEGRVAEKQ